ncbi:type IV-A pilus assembly ATPase PilB [Candidatus Venteria ishoeyi]|uniref:Type II secretion system protein E n=1 Tax=Candidatus Venteria ishoeyi TaxID=1899563 RepID=A0A1H6FBL0_9GAMM|nr:type IV-A pilus assembly ATPase PilB [Candidatus Venteria ishoeyi]MDM8546946.1 type IV-A pilus assembly ATPase PilB [Candidatus Venteria ishoeyi]SEH07467.1 Type II secretion system protein E [Candidatus Venteria ishoeyi]
MATASPKIILGGLARKLVVDGLLEEPVAQQAFQSARDKNQAFVNYVVEQKLVDSGDLAHAAAQEFGVPLLDIEEIEQDQDIINLVKLDLLKKHQVLPIHQRGKHLFVAIADPTNFQALDDIKFHVNMATEAILVDQEKLAKIIEKLVEAAESVMDGMDDEDLDGFGDEAEEQEEKKPEEDDTESDAPVVVFVRKMLLNAIKVGASDLHFEPYEKFYRVRYRIDGVLREIAKAPLSLAGKIAARIKVMSRLDVSERRVPQDGRIKLKLSRTKSIDFRVSTCPTLFGEKTVMRILDSSAAALNIEQLGYEPEQKQLYLDALSNPYGMILVTGPTGSGKTVSLYTGINILNTEGVNISTAEDPVEINLPGVNQVQIDEKTGMSFDKALKAFLRQDPDIILVGEIRDITTGGIAIKAASTGHLVMATLHTNDAPQTVTRMIDMGIKPFAIATAVNLIMAQRLARRLCKHCKRKVTVTDNIASTGKDRYIVYKNSLLEEGFAEEVVAEFMQDSPDSRTLYDVNPEGCDHCSSGFKGRVGIYQVMPVSEKMKRLIIDGSNSMELADQAAEEGIPDLRISGLKKVADGLTCMEEVNRVTLE